MKKKEHIRPNVKGPNGEPVFTEQETRRRLLEKAKFFGFEVEIRQILDKTDALLRNCTNPLEREQIALFGNLEIQRILDPSRSIEININGKNIK